MRIFFNALLSICLMLALSSCENDNSSHIAVKKDMSSEKSAARASLQSNELLAQDRSTTVTNPEIQISSDHQIAIQINLQIPQGYHLNKDAPSGYQLSLFEGSQRTDSVHHHILEGRLSSTALQLNFEPLEQFPEATLHLTLSVFYCREDGKGACLLRSLTFLQPYTLDESIQVNPEVRFKAELSPQKDV